MMSYDHGKAEQNVHHRQVVNWVRAPPTRGPAMRPSWQNPIMMPTRTGRFSSGVAMAMMVRPPFMMPEDPMPATARPMMSMLDEAARPHMREPSSKTATNVKKVH